MGLFLKTLLLEKVGWARSKKKRKKKEKERLQVDLVLVTISGGNSSAVPLMGEEGQTWS